MELAGTIWLVVAFVFLIFVAASIIRGIRGDVTTRPLSRRQARKHQEKAEADAKARTEKINKTQERIQ